MIFLSKVAKTRDFHWLRGCRIISFTSIQYLIKLLATILFNVFSATSRTSWAAVTASVGIFSTLLLTLAIAFGGILLGVLIRKKRLSRFRATNFVHDHTVVEYQMSDAQNQASPHTCPLNQYSPVMGVCFSEFNEENNASKEDVKGYFENIYEMVEEKALIA